MNKTTPEEAELLAIKHGINSALSFDLIKLAAIIDEARAPERIKALKEAADLCNHLENNMNDGAGGFGADGADCYAAIMALRSGLPLGDPADNAKPYAWFWSDGRDSGCMTNAADYETYKAKYPRMTFLPVYTHPAHTKKGNP